MFAVIGGLWGHKPRVEYSKLYGYFKDVPLVIILLTMIIKPLYARLVLKQDDKYDAIYFLALFLLLPINWYTPAIITVNSCNEYTKEITLFPFKKENVDISYGKHLYVFNQSKNKITVEDIAYGNVDAENVQPKLIIEPNKNGIVKKVSIDYIFETPDASVRSKSSGSVRTIMYCNKY